MSFIPSTQQQAFFDWIVNESGSAVLEAVAGSGKTTTLIEALKLMEGSIYFGAYNKKIAEEIKEKAPALDNLNVSTIHSAGFSAWKKVAPKATVEANKCRLLYRDKFNNFSLETPVVNLVSYAKQAAIGITTPLSVVSLGSLVDHFNLDCLDVEADVINMAMQLFVMSTEQDTKVVDFDDMIFSPLFHGAKGTQYDWVLIDEAQDTNESRRLLALSMLKEGGRLVAVGDRHQAIYGFTGADSNALDLIAEATNAIQMPLTVSYRCPTSVVAEAQNYVKHIMAHPEAVSGAVSTLEGELLESVKIGDVILSRFNKHLVELVYSFIAQGIPAKIEGREIGKSMNVLVKRYKSKTFDVLEERLSNYGKREGNKLRLANKETQAVAVEDKVACILVILNRVFKMNPNASNPVDAVITEIEKIFEDTTNNGKVVLLSSIHKSKGREWNNVYWLQTGTAKWAKMDWEKGQEQNLLYVAATRAKENLIKVPMDKMFSTKALSGLSK